MSSPEYRAYQRTGWSAVRRQRETSVFAYPILHDLARFIGLLSPTRKGRDGWDLCSSDVEPARRELFDLVASALASASRSPDGWTMPWDAWAELFLGRPACDRGRNARARILLPPEPTADTVRRKPRKSERPGPTMGAEPRAQHDRTRETGPRKKGPRDQPGKIAT